VQGSYSSDLMLTASFLLISIVICTLKYWTEQGDLRAWQNIMVTTFASASRSRNECRSTSQFTIDVCFKGYGNQLKKDSQNLDMTLNQGRTSIIAFSKEPAARLGKRCSNSACSHEPNWMSNFIGCPPCYRRGCRCFLIRMMPT
jgi:hypothetical protein